MTMTSCPTCQKPVDSLRARNVGVRDGKVVAYCSRECAAAAESRPIQLPRRPPPAGTPHSADDLDSGPVIEIIHEPASGVVTSARDERADSKPVRGDSSGGKGSAIGSGGMDSAVASGELGGSKRARSQPSGRHLTRERKDSTESKAGWDWLDEEPADHTRSRTATGSRAGTEIGRGGKTFVLLLLGFLLLGAAAFGVYYLVLRDAPPKEREIVTPVGAGSTAAAIDAATAVDAGPPPITKETALASAIALLRTSVAESLPRVQRLAAGALGRTGDPEAITTLAQAVIQERVPAARFLLAYQLARAGDKRGIDALVAGLGSPTRGDKLDAATRLAQLGDDRAKPLLTSLLGISQHRLRAAEELWRLKDPAAEKALDQIRTDPKAGIDEKATATLALLRGGRRELAGEVRALLENDSWKAFAAYALAEIKDEAARPVLLEQVRKGVGVRVRAAYALHRLDPEPPPELMAPLVDGLASKKDQEQIMAAEAILVLAGDPQWAKYP